MGIKAAPNTRTKDEPVITREVLALRDRLAWQTYGEACHDTECTPDRRRDLFEDAMEAHEALHEHDRFVL